MIYLGSIPFTEKDGKGYQVGFMVHFNNFIASFRITFAGTYIYIYMDDNKNT